jgi:hypothetical protein
VIYLEFWVHKVIRKWKMSRHETGVLESGELELTTDLNDAGSIETRTTQPYIMTQALRVRRRTSVVQ